MDDVGGLLATLAGMVAMIAVGALQLRRPAVVHVEVDGDRLDVRFSRWDAIWAMKRSFSLPLLGIAHVTASDADTVPRRGMRLPGTAIPGVIRSGTYGTGAQRELWNVRRGHRLLVVDLDPPEPYARIVAEVADPDGVAERVREAVAAARTQPR